MSIKYSCFISYAHGQGNIAREFMRQLKEALVDSLGLLLREEVYMDDRHIPGYNFNDGIAKAICESVCMIVVYSPLYEKSNYCLREFLAMENVEEKRRQKLGSKYDGTKRMIIPLILRGNINSLPTKMEKIHCYDFSKFTLASLKMRKEDKKIIDEIANFIYEHYTNLETIHNNKIDNECLEFTLPPEDEVLRQWKKSAPSIGFPGRRNV